VTLAEKTLENIRVHDGRKGRPKTRPKRLIADKGYDSDLLRNTLKRRGITLLSPYRKNRKKKRKQDGRMRDRYRRRYKVERTFAWFGSFRRLVVRYEHEVSVYTGFFHIACLLITLKRLWFLKPVVQRAILEFQPSMERSPNPINGNIPKMT